MIGFYNNLSQDLVDLPDVKSFQSALTNIAKVRCKRGDSDWHLSFNRRCGPDIDSCVISV